MKNLLIFLLTFLSLGPLGGGGLLMLSPSGSLLGTHLFLLDASPFNDFLIPGTLLFSVIRLIKKPDSKLLEFFNAFKDMHWSWSFTVYIFFTLILWIQIQETLLNGLHLPHTIYMKWGLIILFVSLLPQVRRLYLKSHMISKQI